MRFLSRVSARREIGSSLTFQATGQSPSYLSYPSHQIKIRSGIAGGAESLLFLCLTFQARSKSMSGINVLSLLTKGGALVGLIGAVQAAQADISSLQKGDALVKELASCPHTALRLR